LARHRQPIDAIAIRDGRIIALGRWRELARHHARETAVCDVRDAVVTPGLVDCHTHFFYWALTRAHVSDLGVLPTLDAVLHELHTAARKQRLGGWVLARGFEHNRWPGGLPTAADLDRAVPDGPALVTSRDGHTAWLNTPALRAARISPDTPDPPRGRYLRDPRGRPTGIVQEAAIDTLPNPLRDFAARQDAEATRLIDRALRRAYRAAWACGIVGVHTMDDAASLFHLQRHRVSGELGLRVVHAVPLRDFPAARQLGLRSGLGDEWLRLGGIKIFADGALGSQTAYMLKPYPGRGGYCGVPVIAGEELREAVREITRCGWASWIHAIGDRAAREAVAAIAAAGSATIPHRIEHAQCVRPADMRRMAQARIVASVQPCHLLGDISNADIHWPKARRYAFPLRAFEEAGVTLAAGSDVPIESLDPRRSLSAATNRTDEQGRPAGGWFPQQRLSIRAALRAFTQGAASAISGLNGPGALEVGAPADLTLWAADPLAARPEELLDIGIRGCMVGGRMHLEN
jgi:predicted amidohydrolase YtcJ